MKHSGLQIETNQATAPPNNVDAIVLRERITNLREVVDDLRRRAEDVTCTSPVGELQGVQAFRGFQEGFAKMIKKLTLIAAFGDDEHAVIVYNSETYPVPNAIVAEHIAVKNGKLASTTVIYDGTPFAEYMKTARPH